MTDLSPPSAGGAAKEAEQRDEARMIADEAEYRRLAAKTPPITGWNWSDCCRLLAMVEHWRIKAQRSALFADGERAAKTPDELRAKLRTMSHFDRCMLADAIVAGWYADVTDALFAPTPSAPAQGAK